MQPRTVLRSILAVAAVAFCTAAQGQLFRAYLSGTGSDANPCTRDLPCRLLPAGLNAIADGGEVWMLDSANYNVSTVNITKSASVLAVPGVVGSVVATGGPAISIGTADVHVSLRNLVIVPLPGGGGTSGIVMTNGDNLIISETTIARHNTHGITVSSGSYLKVMNSVIRGNGSSGIFLSGGAIGEVSNVKFIGNDSGISVNGSAGITTTVAVTDSVLSGNVTGIQATANVATSVARWTAIRTTASNNTNGFVCSALAGAATSCTLGYSKASANIGTGLLNTGGTSTFRSMGNNLVIDNAADTLGTITPYAGT